MSRIDTDELVDKFIEQNKLFNMEGSTGLRNLDKIVNVIGYENIDEFLMDNPGAIEGIISFVREIVESNQTWEDDFRDAVDEEDEDEEEELEEDDDNNDEETD